MSEKILNRILHVDDEADIQLIAKLALETIGGFTVELCTSGQEALDKAGRFDPDLIVLDVMMPDMDGLETFKKLSCIEAVCDVPIIFMTARTHENEIAELMDLGAVGVIQKPFDPMTLTSQIKSVWKSYISEDKV